MGAISEGDVYQARESRGYWRFLRAGNSLKSDILPVIALGGRAVDVPYQLTWVHETVVEPETGQDYFQLDHLEQLPALVARLSDESV